VGSVVDKVTLGQDFSEYFVFPYQSSFHPLLHIHQYLSAGGGYNRPVVAAVPSGLGLILLKIIKNIRCTFLKFKTHLNFPKGRSIKFASYIRINTVYIYIYI
jgi:hypothetical protein